MCKQCPVVDWDAAFATIESFGGVPAIGGVMSDLIVWYDRYDREHKPRVGGKNASLGELMMADLPVPPGFAVTVEAYQQMWRNKDLADAVNAELRGIDHGDFRANRATADRIRALIEAEPMAPEVVEAVTDSYQALCTFCNVDDLPVAVRSSATAEAQEIVSNKTIEVNRCSGSCINLNRLQFRQVPQRICECEQVALSVFKRRPFRHIEHNLKF